MPPITLPRFSLGKLVATPAALETLQRFNVTAEKFLRRHLIGDWSEMSEFDQEQNEDALRLIDGLPNGRVFSSYKLNDTEDIWIITEHDRSSTCILLPSEY